MHSRRQGPSPARGRGVGVRAGFPLSSPTPPPLPFGYNTPHEPGHHPHPRPPAPPAVLAGAPPGLLRPRAAQAVADPHGHGDVRSGPFGSRQSHRPRLSPLPHLLYP